MLYTVRGLEQGIGGVDIRVRVVSKEPQRKVKTKDGVEHIVVDARVGDRTGAVVMSLWDDLTDEVEVGDMIDIQNGYVTRFKGRLRLNLSRYGHVRKIEEPHFPTVREIVEGEERKKQWRKVTFDKS